MKVLDEQDGIDSELLVFAMTLINKTMYGIPDQDTFYDVADALEMQNIDKIQERYRSKKGLDKKGTESLKSHNTKYDDDFKIANPTTWGYKTRVIGLNRTENGSTTTKILPKPNQNWCKRIKRMDWKEFTETLNCGSLLLFGIQPSRCSCRICTIYRGEDIRSGDKWRRKEFNAMK